MGLLEEEKQLLEERVKELTLQLEKSHERERVSLDGESEETRCHFIFPFFTA